MFTRQNKAQDRRDRVKVKVKVKVKGKVKVKEIASTQYNIRQVIRSCGSVGANYIEASEDLGQMDEE